MPYPHLNVPITPLTGPEEGACTTCKRLLSEVEGGKLWLDVQYICDRGPLARFWSENGTFCRHEHAITWLKEQLTPNGDPGDRP